MNIQKPTFDLKPMHFYAVLDHIKGITEKLIQDELDQYLKGNRGTMDSDQMGGMIFGMVASAAEAELRLWMKARTGSI